MAQIEKRRQKRSDGSLGPVRWRARYRGPDGRERSQTFPKRSDAEHWLASVEGEKARGTWLDPALGKVTFAVWLEDWTSTTSNLRPATLDLYAYLARRYLLPAFGQAPLAKITAQDVRSWLASMRATDLSPNTVAKAYRLLARVMGAAVEAGVIGRSPCVVRGASTERSPEMRFATVDQLAELANAVQPRYRALVLTAAYAGLRWGELAGLRRRRVNLLHATITVAEQLTEVNGRLEVGPPKTEAGRRAVALPAFLVVELEQHLASWSEPGPEGLVFPAPEGGPMRRSNFRRRAWEPAVRHLDLVGLRFHDLRHSAGTLTAVAGATTKELMARMGHSSPRAALIYQHATAERDAAVAAALDALAASPRPGNGESSRASVAHLR